MRTMFALTLSAALAAFPYVLAHDGGLGLPKAYCEWDDTRIHEYSVGLVAGQAGWQSDYYVRDFTLGESVDHSDADAARRTIEDLQDGASTFCRTDESHVGDGHYEFAVGGAVLLVDSLSERCWGTYADHTRDNPIRVVDASGTSTAFRIGVDHLDNAAPLSAGETYCGDMETDRYVDCVDSCDPMLLPASLDGSIQVYVFGTTGHVHL